MSDGTIAENEAAAAAVEEAVLRLTSSVEALLFVAGEPLSIKQIAKLTRASEIEVAATLARVTNDFAERGIVVREAGGGYRFATSPLARDVVEA